MPYFNFFTIVDKAWRQVTQNTAQCLENQAESGEHGDSISTPGSIAFSIYYATKLQFLLNKSFLLLFFYFVDTLVIFLLLFLSYLLVRVTQHCTVLLISKYTLFQHYRKLPKF